MGRFLHKLEQVSQGKVLPFQLPLRFEPNVGEGVDFIVKGKGYSLGLTSQKAVFAFLRNKKISRLSMVLNSARPTQAKGEAKQPGTSNYFRGGESSQWRIGVPGYARVRYEDIYPIRKILLLK